MAIALTDLGTKVISAHCGNFILVTCEIKLMFKDLLSDFDKLSWIVSREIFMKRWIDRCLSSSVNKYSVIYVENSFECEESESDSADTSSFEY